MMGAQASHDQLEKILGYIKIGKEEGAKCMTGGEQAHLGGDLEKGYYVKPTVFVGHNKMRVFQEEIFGPVLSVTKFKDLDDAIQIGNDTVYGLGAGVWSRNGTNTYRVGREIHAGRVWTNCYHLYPAGAAFGGYKQSGFGRETHKIILEEPVGQLQSEGAGLLLNGSLTPWGRYRPLPCGLHAPMLSKRRQL